MNVTVVHVRRQVPVTILQAHGELDASTYQQLIARAREVYDAGARNIILDMSGIACMSSCGLVALHSIALLVRGEAPLDPEDGWAVWHAIARDLDTGTQQHFKLLSPRPEVEQTLDQANFKPFLKVYNDLDAAIASCESPAVASVPQAMPPMHVLPSRSQTAGRWLPAITKPLNAVLGRVFA